MVKKIIFLVLAIVLLALPSGVAWAASSRASTTATVTVEPYLIVETTGTPFDLTVHVKSNCNMSVVVNRDITSDHDIITVEKQIKE